MPDRVGTLLQAWELYWDLWRCELQPKTQAEYRTAIKHCLSSLPDRPTVQDVLRFRASLAARYSIAYVNMITVVLRVCCRRAAEADPRFAGLARVTASARPLRPPVRLPRLPPAGFVEGALGVARNPAETAFIELQAFAGLRLGEVMGLRPSDLVAATIRVERQRNNTQRKNRRPHVVVVDDAAMLVHLKWTVENHHAIRPRAGWHRGKSVGHLFPWAQKYVDLFLHRIRKATNLPRGLGWHCFRHWGATHLALDGASVIEVMAWLGDASPNVATQYVAMTRGETTASVSRLKRTGRALTRSTGPLPSANAGRKQSSNGKSKATTHKRGRNTSG